MEQEVDVLIVGGGPAGLAAGIALSACGIRALVCEQKQYPVDKPCGEGIMPTGVAALKRLGAAAYLPPDHYFQLDGVKYIAPGGRVATGRFLQGPGWGASRTELSNALYALARQCERLEVRQGARVQLDREFQGKALEGLVQASVQGERIAARLLVGADGLNSGVRRWAGLAGPPGRWKRWGARQHFRVQPWSNCVEVHWGPGVEAYITPAGEQLVGVAFLWDASRCEGVAGGKDLMPSLLAKFPELERRLQGAEALDTPGAVGPLQRLSRGVAAPGVLLLGDAAGYLDALTGEGISLALAQALALPATIGPALQSPGRGALSKGELSAYARAYRAMVKPYYQMTGLLLALGRYPWMVELSIRMLARRPLLFGRLLSASMGQISMARAWLG